MAMENPLVVADVVEANEFPELSERFAVRSVPKTIRLPSGDQAGSRLSHLPSVMARRWLPSGQTV